jgi:hypothetical protein
MVLSHGKTYFIHPLFTRPAGLRLQRKYGTKGFYLQIQHGKRMQLQSGISAEFRFELCNHAGKLFFRPV